MAVVNLTSTPGTRFQPGSVAIYKTTEIEMFRAMGREPIEPPLGSVELAADGTIQLDALGLPVFGTGRALPSGEIDRHSGAQQSVEAAVTHPPVSYSAYQKRDDGPDAWLAFSLA